MQRITRPLWEIFKKALIENAMGYDAKDDRLSGNPNQMNIQSMYSDIDTDANDTESEAQATMDDVLWFVNCHLANTGQGDFEGWRRWGWCGIQPWYADEWIRYYW